MRYTTKLKEELIAIYTSSKAAKDKEHEILDRVFQVTGEETSYSTISRLIRKWKQKKVEDTEELDDRTFYGQVPYAVTEQRDANGELVQSWVKSKPEEVDMMEQMTEALRELQTRPIPLKPRDIKDRGRLLEIPLFDMHFGVARYKHYKRHQRKILNIIEQGDYNEIIFVIGQDLFHNNDFKGNTSNGTQIETVDMPRATRDAWDFFAPLIEAAHLNSKKVEIIYSRGNHDQTPAWYFCFALERMFGDHIDFDLACSEFDDKKVRVFGKVFIGWKHGDKGKSKVKDVRGVFAEKFKKQWARTECRELHFGHLHHEWAKDAYGFVVRHLSSAAKTDAWHDINDYINNHKRFQLFEYDTKELIGIHYI